MKNWKYNSLFRFFRFVDGIVTIIDGTLTVLTLGFFIPGLPYKFICWEISVYSKLNLHPDDYTEVVYAEDFDDFVPCIKREED